MEIIGQKDYNGMAFTQCRCSCGSVFFTPTEDVEAGEVHSCGHPLAGMDLQRILSRKAKASLVKLASTVEVEQ